MKTARLELKFLEKKDYAAWKRAHQEQQAPQNRWDTQRKTLRDLTPSRYFEIIRSHKKERKLDTRYVYGIFCEGKLLGSLSLMNVSRGQTHSAYIGYSLFNNHWGKGYATEALEGLLEIAFKEQKLHRVVAGIEPGNRRSVKLVTKFGFRHEGLSKRVVLLRGEWQDLNQYALTCEEYGVVWQG